MIVSANANPVERRRQKLREMPVTHLEARHTQSGQLLPDRESLLDHLPSGARVAEIGVAKGEFSRKILDHTAPKALHLIDAWRVDRFRNGLRQVKKRFAAEIGSGQVIIHQGLSTDILPDFAPASFDWVYIDTNHSYQTTIAELHICNDLVAKGGVIAGHDFCVGNVVKPVVYGVIQAVNEFCVELDWRYEYVTLESGGHFSFCLTRI